MNVFQLKSHIKAGAAPWLFLAATLVFCAFCLLISDIFVPFAAALLAIVWLTDRTDKRWISLSLSALIVLAFLLVDPLAAVLALPIVIAAPALAFCYARGISKGECSLYLTLVFFLGSLFYLVLSICVSLDSFVFSDVLAYIESIFDDWKAQYVQTLMQSLEGTDVALGDMTEYIDTVFLAFYNLFPALVAILGFFYAGLCLKVFTSMTQRIFVNARTRRDWRFLCSSVFGYFYLALFVLTFIFDGFDSTLSIALMNLYYVFLCVFGYLGVRHAFLFAARTRNPALSRVLVIVFLVLGNVLTLQILSISGVLFSVINNKLPPVDGNGTSPDGRGGSTE